jgi:hypothetical protein
LPGFSIEESPLGRIVVAPEVPEGHRLFYTTRDSEGAIGEALRAYVGMDIGHCKQVHGLTVTRCGGGECDALWSDGPAALAIKVADCLPVSLIGDGVIANVHAGWRGAAKGIIDATLDALPGDAALRLARPQHPRLLLRSRRGSGGAVPDRVRGPRQSQAARRHRRVRRLPPAGARRRRRPRLRPLHAL